jgi:tetratricopeptide (TPR) repeat protein
MMGNIFIKHKNDIDTALVYYNQILKHTPDNYITLNNIGAVLKQTGKNDEALSYFLKASEINPTYPNTNLAIGIIKEEQGRYLEAFNCSLKAIKHSKVNEEVYDKSMGLCISSALKYSEGFNNELFINKTITDFSKESDKKIVIEEDDKISTAAKIEFAENHNREFHLVKFKPDYDSATHLILHELMHLELVIEARSVEENMLFTTNASTKIKFENSLGKFKNELLKKGLVKESVINFIDSLYNGLNSQVYNTPIDLFIEDRINKRYEIIKPQQFLSLLRFVKEGITATTRKDIVSNVPKNVLSISKTYNLVNAIYFKDVFFIDLIKEFKATKLELDLANKLFKEFLEYRLDKKEGAEYELVQHWGEDLKFDTYFNLIPASEHKRKTIDDVIDSVNNDPY